MGEGESCHIKAATNIKSGLVNFVAQIYSWQAGITLWRIGHACQRGSDTASKEGSRNKVPHDNQVLGGNLELGLRICQAGRGIEAGEQSMESVRTCGGIEALTGNQERYLL